MVHSYNKWPKGWHAAVRCGECSNRRQSTCRPRNPTDHSDTIQCHHSSRFKLTLRPRRLRDRSGCLPALLLLVVCSSPPFATTEQRSSSASNTMFFLAANRPKVARKQSLQRSLHPGHEHKAQSLQTRKNPASTDDINASCRPRKTPHNCSSDS